MQNKENSKYEIIYKNGKYVAPYIDLLKDYSKDEIFMDPDRIKGLAETLQELFDAFRLAVNVVDATATSLAITFKVIVDPGESVKAIYKIKVDIEVALGSFVEMEYMPEEENTILISAKNIDRPLIGLKNIIGSKCFMETLSPLSVAAGIDVQGNELIIDIAEAPHILVAGTTGSGKSIFIDDIILSILFNASPEEVRLLLIDPKYVELMAYNGIPHLLGPVIKDADEALNSFLWIEDEIMRRYDSFSKKDAKNIEAYNAIVSKVNEVQLPRILIIIDEYMDLILTSPAETNQVIDRITRLGRAAGIHLLLATQLPVAKIVTPQIKANIPCRASFTVVDGRESRIILNATGAERLLGSGDMIFSQSDSDRAIHAQAAYVSDTELWNVVDFVKNNN